MPGGFFLWRLLTKRDAHSQPRTGRARQRRCADRIKRDAPTLADHHVVVMNVTQNRTGAFLKQVRVEGGGLQVVNPRRQCATAHRDAVALDPRFLNLREEISQLLVAEVVDV